MKIGVIGAGFSGIAAATVLAYEGHQVTVFEKNSTPGGRARKFEAAGFTFDMGPSWYWMPEVFEQYFSRFGKKVSDYYTLKRLDPSYRVIFGKNDFVDVPASYDKLLALFESLESGAGKKLDQFLDEAAYKYKVGMEEFVWKPSLSILEFLDIRIFKSALKLQMFSSISKQIRSLFSHPQIIQILEFPVLFLGATPQKTPALYSLMNYADLVLGTWYPEGGMFQIIRGMVSLAKELGVEFKYNHAVDSFETNEGKIIGIKVGKNLFEVDGVVAGADYHHIDQEVMEEKNRQYSREYWDKRTMAPSSLLFYIGMNRKMPIDIHHTLFFDRDFDTHATEIYTHPQWPTAPLFYMCIPSSTDKTVAAEGHENVFLLMPLAPGITDSAEKRDKYFNLMCDRIQELLDIDIRPSIIYNRSYCVNDFEADYNAFKGNAYGLANTLNQTAILKPKIKSKNLKNLYFTGQLTAPGPGVPPSLISGQMVAETLIKDLVHGPAV